MPVSLSHKSLPWQWWEGTSVPSIFTVESKFWIQKQAEIFWSLFVWNWWKCASVHEIAQIQISVVSHQREEITTSWTGRCRSICFCLFVCFLKSYYLKKWDSFHLQTNPDKRNVHKKNPFFWWRAFKGDHVETGIAKKICVFICCSSVSASLLFNGQVCVLY